MQIHQKPALVILAAGMGSRYGGLKQLDTFTPENDTIIDFSLFDAITAGFGKVVFVIRKHFKNEFIGQYSKKLEGKINVEYVFQEVDEIPSQFFHPDRVKPWGTGHALLCTKSAITSTENFAVINADDFYGKEAFKAMSEFLNQVDSNSSNFSMMGYQLQNTLSKFGSVSRGECFVDDNQNLIDVVERTQIFEKDNNLVMNVEGEIKPIERETTVSMNFWGFTPEVFNYMDKMFEAFLSENWEKPKSEFYIPSIVNELLQAKKATVKVLESDAKWLGVTYPEDKEYVTQALRELKNQELYPKQLWD